MTKMTMHALVFSLKFAMTLTSSLRVAKPISNTTIESRPTFTRLSRFDVEAWAEPHLLPLKMQASALSKLPGTYVSQRQMLALMGQRNGINGTGAEVKRLRGFGLANDIEGLRPREVLRLEDLDGSEYAGVIEVGTKNGSPQAKLRVIFDTGSTDLWVLSDLCQSSPCTHEGRHMFNHKHSNTYSPPPKPVELSTYYGSGELYGLLGFDVVRMGPLVVPNQMLGLISKEVGYTFEDLAFDGLVGLGFRSLGFDVPGAAPIVDRLMQQGSLPSPCFGFYLHRDPIRGGAVLWGGADERLYHGPLRWFPVVQEAYWSLDIVSFRVGGKSFNFEEAKKGKHGRFTQRLEVPMQKPLLVVDSGTTMFTIPGFMLSAFHSEIGFGVTRCSQMQGLPPLVFVIRDASGAEQELTAKAEEYMVRNMHFDDVCLPAVVKMDLDADEQPLMIIGEVFMRHFFTVFSRGEDGAKSQVGFARSKEDAEAEAFFAESKAATDKV